MHPSPDKILATPMWASGFELACKATTHHPAIWSGFQVLSD